jgi:ATP-dependent RNA helicase TDRD9
MAGAFYPNYFLRQRPNKKEYERSISRDLAGADPLHTLVYNGFPQEQPGEL